MKLFLILYFTSFGFCVNGQEKIDFPDLSTLRKEERIVEVQLDNLISNPQNYDRKVVKVKGFLNLEFEGTSIYLTENDYDNRNFKKAIILNISSVPKKENKKSYVTVIGRFRWKSIIGSPLYAKGTIEKVFEVIKH